MAKAETTAGQSREGGPSGRGRAVLVTPSGEEVGSALIPRRGGTGEQARNQLLAEERARQEAIRKQVLANQERARQEATKREQEQQRKQEQRNKILEERLLKSQRERQRITKRSVITFSQKQKLKVLQSRERTLQKQITKPIITGVVRRVEVPKKTPQRLVQRLELLQGKASTQSIRSEQEDIKNELKLLGFTVGNTIVAGTLGLVALPQTLVTVAKTPSLLLKIPGALGRSAREFGQLIRVSPTEAFAKIGGEIIFLKGAGTSLRAVGKVTGNAATRLDPKFKGITNNKINLRTAGGVTTIRVGGTVKKIAEPLRKQARLAGKRVTAVSAQADRLVTFIKKQKIVRKPIPGEAEFSPRIKKLLKKFDDKKINRDELLELEGKVPVLERSFFADPRGRFRPSRLGAKPKDASLIDFLAGDFTFKASKPQIIVFENVKVSKFPKALKDIEKDLRSGKTLTESQGKRLLRFQTQKGGKFKPIGALSKEPEITLAPGEIIKRVKKAGVTIVNGKRVDIIFAKIVKPTKTTSKLLKKSNLGKLTNKELKQLRKNLKRESGFEPRLSRSTRIKPRARLPKRVPTRPPKRAPRRTPTRITRPSSRVTPRITRRDARGRIVRLAPRLATRAITRPPKRLLGRPLRRAARIPRRPVKAPVRVAPVIRVTDIIRKPKKGKPQQVFNVFGKSRGKFVRLNRKPLTREDALSKGAFAIDRTTARTFKISPAGKSKKPGALLKNEKNYFNRQGFKLREVKIKKGRKFKLRNKFIEKTKFAIDTRSEKQGLTIAKLLKQQRRPTPTKARKILRDKNIRGKRLTPRQTRFFRGRADTKRTITPSQKKILIQRLVKARKIKSAKRR